ncbi:MAG: YdiU family protein [Acidobacteriota bacterium]|nr:YdiU family protein [Acidobacteriota bacterium]
MPTLETLRFDNTYARLPEVFYRRVEPTPLPAPYLVSFNAAAAELIGLDPREAARPEFVEYFGGNRRLPGGEPVAAVYAGHQFGTFVPQLGDGRAILLGEAVGPRGGRWDVQLKGAGLTPFSRMGDGRAVLRSTIREYLCGEAMHALGIPTTRALCIVGSDEPVIRETIETAAVLTRLAPTHVRFGSFELFYYRGQLDRVRELADYVIRQHYPHLDGARDKYLQFLREVVGRTARLVARWQAVGFAHGVMNTDNMSVVGLTIDYGPFGFLDEFDAGFVCNHSDYGGRYAFDRQPAVALWNLSRFAQTLLTLVERDAAFAALDEYQHLFADAYGGLMRAKLGLQGARPGDAALLSGLLKILQAAAADYTLFFRRLGEFKTATDAGDDLLRDMFIDRAAFDVWAGAYRARLLAEGSDDAERRGRMARVNPLYVLRNHVAQRAIEQAQKGDYAEVDTLLGVLQSPFDERPGAERFAEPPPEGSRRVVVSCSS